MRQGNGKCDICGKVRGIAWSDVLKKSICLDCSIEIIEDLKELIANIENYYPAELEAVKSIGGK